MVGGSSQSEEEQGSPVGCPAQKQDSGFERKGAGSGAGINQPWGLQSTAHCIAQPTPGAMLARVLVSADLLPWLGTASKPRSQSVIKQGGCGEKQT